MIQKLRKTLSNQTKLGLGSSSAIIFGQDVIVTGLNFLANVIAGRWLGPIQLGYYYVVNLIPTYSEKFGRVGMAENAAVFYLGKKKYRLGELSGHLTLIGIAFSLVPIGLYAGFQEQFRSFLLKTKTVPDYYVWTAVAAVPFVFLLISYNKLLIALNRVRDLSVVQLTRAVVFLSLCLYFWAADWDLFGLCIAFGVAVVIAALMDGYFLWQQEKFDFSIKPGLIGDLFGYGWKIYILSVLTFLHQKFDLVMVAFFLGAKEVSFYATAALLGQLLWKFPHAASTLLFAKVSSSDKEKGIKMTVRTFANTFFILIFGALALALVCQPLVQVSYGKKFLPLIKPLLILLPGIVSMGLCAVIVHYFLGKGSPWGVVRAGAIATSINVILNLYLTPVYGIMATACISSCTYTLYLGFLVFEFVRSEKVAVLKLFTLAPEDQASLKRVLRIGT